MELVTSTENLLPRHPFTLSRGTKYSVDNILVCLTEGDVSGWGEASPNRFYGESAVEVRARLDSLGPALKNQCLESPEDIAGLWHELWPRLAPYRSAQCALDVALWDLLARRRGLSLHRLIHQTPAAPLVSSVTAALASPEEWPKRRADLRGFPILKIKVDQTGSTEYLRFLKKEFPQARLWLDANCGLSANRLRERMPEWVSLGVELLEQPLPPGTPLPPEVLRQTDLPVIADESCVVREDVPKAGGQFHGINIKLSKCGGLTPALSMVREARALGLKVMVGCMLESECLIAAGLVVGQGADYVDLDGNWLLKTRLFGGLHFEPRGVWVEDTPGLGVNRLES